MKYYLKQIWTSPVVSRLVYRQSGQTCLGAINGPSFSNKIWQNLKFNLKLPSLKVKWGSSGHEIQTRSGLSGRFIGKVGLWTLTLGAIKSGEVVLPFSLLKFEAFRGPNFFVVAQKFFVVARQEVHRRGLLGHDPPLKKEMEEKIIFFSKKSTQSG